MSPFHPATVESSYALSEMLGNSNVQQRGKWDWGSKVDVGAGHNVAKTAERVVG